jgi:hypothetical protein
MKLTFEEFCQDGQGRTYGDVISGAPKALKELLLLVSEPDRQRRLEWAEEEMDRPALAGVALELGRQPAVAKVLEGEPNFAKRFRQVAGAAVRIVMEGRGWRKTGRKGAVGVGTHFSRAERYERQQTAVRKAAG